MSSDKDYYAILGVLPSAEDIVIRAAYRALAQRYHPDRAQASENTTARMAEINEAYRVLSDPVLREHYDAQRKSSSAQGQPDYQGFDDDPPPSPDPLDKDWILAKRFYPDLQNMNTRLEKISWRLASAFRATLLDNKAFEKRELVASSMERGFLERYFGKNPKIIDFASSVIQSGHRKVAKDLNEAIRVLGGDASPDVVIATIASAHPDIFQQRHQSTSLSDLRFLVDKVKHGGESFYCYEKLIQAVGGKISPVSFFSSKYEVDFHGKRIQMKWSELNPWYINNIVPLVSSG